MRINVDYVNPDLLQQVLLAGRKLETTTDSEIPEILAHEIKELQSFCKMVDLK